MISDGYKAYVNRCDVASVVKEYVAIIAVVISCAGNGGGFVYGCLCIHSHYAIEGR